MITLLSRSYLCANQTIKSVILQKNAHILGGSINTPHGNI